MNPCNEIYIIKFIDHELSKTESAEFEKHLQTCEKCTDLYRQIADVDRLMNTVERDNAPAALYKSYKQELASLFAKDPLWKQAVSTIRVFFLAPRRSVLRFAQAAAFILVGILIGRLTVQSPVPDGPPYGVQYTQNPVEYDAEFIQNYFSRTEFLLLAIKNSSKTQVTSADWAINKEIAENLLAQKEMIYQAGIGEGNEIVNYLSQLEMILLEISNREPEQISTIFSILKEMVKETDLVQTTRQIQRQVLVKNAQV